MGEILVKYAPFPKRKHIANGSIVLGNANWKMKARTAIVLLIQRQLPTLRTPNDRLTC